MADKKMGYFSGFDSQLWLLFYGGVVSSVGHSIAFPFFSLYLYNQVGISMTLIGTGLALGSVVGVASQFLAGPLSDTIGRRPVMLAGILSTAALTLCYIFVSSFEQFLLIELLFGISGSLYPTASRAMVADITPQGRRARAYGLLYIAGNVGGAVGPGLGGFIAVIGYHYLFGASAGTELIIFVVFLLLVRESINRTRLKTRDEGISRSVLGMKRVFSDRTFMLYCAISVAEISVYAMMYSVLPVFAKNVIGVDELGIGIMWMLNCSMVVGLQMPIARFVENKNRGTVLFVGTLFYAVGFGGLALAADLTALLFLMAIITIGENFMTPASAALVADLAPEDMRGRYMAFQGIVWSVAFGIGPLAGGLMLDYTIDLLWPVAGLTCFIASFGFLVLRRSPGAQPSAAG